VTFHAFGSYQTYDMADVKRAMRAALEAFPGPKPTRRR